MNFRTWLVIFALLCLQVKGRNETKSSRKAKLFSLFNVVRFDNSGCTGLATNGGSSNTGTCFTASECVSLGGASIGSCAAGFGVCCRFIIRSATGGTVTQNGTSLQTPLDQSALADGSSIAFRVRRLNSDVCFLRLDFETFNILGPANTLETMGGVCVDTFTVTTGTGTPVICGLNTGEHIFVDFGSNMESMLQFMFGTAPGGTMVVRDWDIKVDQIPCTGPTSPREGCFQYHTELTGQIKTFNFDGPTGHLANQRYSSCIRQAEGYCCVEYQICPPPIMNSFTIDQTTNPMREGTCGLLANDADFLIIAGASASCSTDPNRRLRSKFCGNTFNVVENPAVSAPVCDCSPPFEVSFVTDGAVPMPNNQVQMIVPQGVCLVYRQVLC